MTDPARPAMPAWTASVSSGSLRLSHHFPPENLLTGVARDPTSRYDTRTDKPGFPPWAPLVPHWLLRVMGLGSFLHLLPFLEQMMHVPCHATHC